jgi:hypothetical protein
VQTTPADESQAEKPAKKTEKKEAAKEAAADEINIEDIPF